MSIRFFDMFAGIGGFRSGLEAVGGFQCVGSCEIDPYARKAYETLYDTKGELFFADARTIAPEELPDLDLICGGFPCQSFSIAGKRLGFHDDARGTLFFEIARIAEARRPALLLLENVPGLLSHDQGRTFAVILSTLDELGYDVAWKVLNSKDFGVPQSRKRVYIAGFLRGKCAGQVFPDWDTNPAAVVPVSPGQRGGQGNRIYRGDGLSCTLTSNGGGFAGNTGLYAIGLPIKVNSRDGFQMAYPGDSIDLSFPTSQRRKSRVSRQIARTLTTADTLACVAESHRVNDSQEIDDLSYQNCIRKLTPRECWRLQGFTDEQFDKVAAEGISNCQLYKMAGNAVTVPVIAALGRFLMDIWTEGVAE